MERIRSNAGSPATRFLLLPLFGVVAAVVSFVAASPFVGSISARDISLEDPASHYTFGTQWANVQYPVFGSILCGTFCFILAAQRKGLLQGAASGLLGVMLGGIVGWTSNAVSDLIGIAMERRAGSTVPFLPEIVWCLVVPAAYALTIALASGPTLQRIKRAFLASALAFVASFVARQAAGVVMLPMVMRGANTSITSISNPSDMLGAVVTASIPSWLAETIAVGIVLGLMIAAAENMSRAGSVRLVLGRNEGRDWNLDHAVNRIGSSEGTEISVRGLLGLEPVHAQIVQQNGAFSLQAFAPLFLNGQPVQDAPLYSGDTFQLGTATFVFSAGAKRAVPVAQTWAPPPAAPAYPEASIRPMPTGMPRMAVVQAPAMPQLVDAVGRVFDIGFGVTTIGRDAGNAICLAGESSVSRRHAEITMDATGAHIRDVGSSNGTRVNGQVIQASTFLRPGDQVQLGAVSFTFRA